MELQPSIELAQQSPLFGSSGGSCFVDNNCLSQLPKIVLTKLTVDPKLFKLKKTNSSSIDKASCIDSSAIQISDEESFVGNSGSMVVSFPLTKPLKSWMEKKRRSSGRPKRMMGKSLLKPTCKIVVRKSPRSKQHTASDCTEDESETSMGARSVEEHNRARALCKKIKKEFRNRRSKEKATTSECEHQELTKLHPSVDSVLKPMKQIKVREQTLKDGSEKRRPITRSKHVQRLSFSDIDESDVANDLVLKEKEQVESQASIKDTQQSVHQSKPSSTSTDDDKGLAAGSCVPSSETEIEVVLSDGDFNIVVIDQPPTNSDTVDIVLSNQRSESVDAKTSTSQRSASSLPLKKELSKTPHKRPVKQVKKKASSKGGIKMTSQKFKGQTKPGKTVTDKTTSTKTADKKGSVVQKQNSVKTSQPKKKLKRAASVMSNKKKGEVQNGGDPQKSIIGRQSKSPISVRSTVKKSLMLKNETDKSKLSLDIAEDSAQLQSGVDSGYPTSASSYETSSSSGPNSKSPDLLTPNLDMTEYGPNFTLDESHHHRGLILNHKDPILQDSNLNDPEFPNQVLDSTQVLTMFDPNFLQNVHANFTIDETQHRMGSHSISHQDPIFPELEILLNENVNLEQLLEPANQIVIERVESLNGNNENETVEICEVDDILQSDTVAQCLKELQRSGKIACGSTDGSPMKQEPLANRNPQQIPTCTEVKNVAANASKRGDQKPALNPPRQRVVYQVDDILAEPLPKSGADNVDPHHIVVPDAKATKEGKRRRKKRVIVRSKKEDDTASFITEPSPPDSPTWSSPSVSSDRENAHTALSVMSRTKSGRRLKPSWKVVANALTDDSIAFDLSDNSAESAECSSKLPVVSSILSAPSVGHNTDAPLIDTSPTPCIDNPVPSPRVPVATSSLPPLAAETSHSELEPKKPAANLTSHKDPKRQGKKEKIIVVKNGEKKRKVKIIRSTEKKVESSKQPKISDSVSDSTKTTAACINPPSTSSSVSTPQKIKEVSSQSVVSKTPLRKKVLCFSPTHGQIEVTLLDCVVKLSRCDLSGLTKKEGVQPHKVELSSSQEKMPPLRSFATINSDSVKKKRKITNSPKDKAHSLLTIAKPNPVSVADSALKIPDLDGKEKTSETTKKKTSSVSNSLSMSLDVILKEMGDKSQKTSSQKPQDTSSLSLDLALGAISDNDLLDKGFDTNSYTNASSLCPLPDLDSKEVTFRDPLENTPYSCDYSISLTDQEITDLILSPLADDESSDMESNTEALFAPPPSSHENSIPPSSSSVTGEDNQHERKPSDKLKSKLSVKSADEDGSKDESRAVCVDADICSTLGENENHTQESEISDQDHNRLSPVPTKKFHLSEGGEDGGEDCIDLYPEDGDIFAQDIDEDPLAKIFPKAMKSKMKIETLSREINKHGATPSDNESGVLPMELCDTYSSLDLEVSPPVSMPYKKKQVSQWVAEQQRRVSGKFVPPGPLLSHGMFHFPSHGLGGVHSMAMTPIGGNISRGPLFRSYVLDSRSTDVPPPPPPPIPPLMGTCSSPVPSPFFATTLPSGPRSTHSQESVREAIVTTPTLPTTGGLGGYCKNFIRGFCNYIPCKFRHVHRDSAPLSVVEDALFRQPLEKIPVDVVNRFAADFHSNSLLKNKFSSLVDLVRALLDRNFSQTLTCYKNIAKFGVKFSAALLSQILELCTFQSPSIQKQFLVSTEVIFDTIKQARGNHNSEDYHLFLKVLVNCDAKKQALRVYNSMKVDRVEPILDTLFLMLRLGKLPEYRYSPIILLEDIKLCHPKPVEEARIVNRIIDTAEYPFSKDHSAILGKWLEASPAPADKLTFESYHKLFDRFSFYQQWGYFISLLKNCPCHLHDMRIHVCPLVMKAVEQIGPTVNVLSVIEKLSEEQRSGIDSHVWNTILMECAKTGRSQRATKFYQWLSEKKKDLPAETFLALMEMYLKQHCPSACITILRDALKQSPPILPPVTLLNPLCQTLEKVNGISDIMLIIRAQLTTNVNPPAVILNTLFSINSKEKIQPKLAEVVKLSCECGAILDKEFYQKCLIELRQWGRDQDAISAVYRALRKVEGLDDNLLLSSPKQSTSPLPKRPPIPQKLLPSSPLLVPSISQSLPSTSTAGDKRKTETQIGDVSLEGVLQCGTVQDKGNVFNLIQVNGTQGQFGAVAAILVSLQSTNSLYDSSTIHAVWKAITSSPERAANAFSNLLLHLDQFRSASVNAGSGKSLLACDRWLVSQIGIALMRTCEQSQDWQSGFVILHHLHRYGIHYVNYSHPHSSLPPLMPHPPSSCSVALMAVNMCLHVNQITGALEVLRGCEWVKASRSDELEPRTELLCSLAEKCLETKMYQDVWKCLEAVGFCTILKKFIHIVTNLHNKLLQNVLALDQSNFALSIYHGMRSAKLQCLPSIFSNMLQSLCDSKQEDLARELCKTAISDGSYCPLVRDNLFKVFLPIGLVRVELHLLLEEHLRRVAREVWRDKKQHQPLYIQFGTGCRHILEQVLVEDFSPSLKAVFAGKSASNASIPASSLQQWFDTNETISVSQTLSVDEATASGDGKPSKVVCAGQKRRCNSRSSSSDGGNKMENDMERPPEKVPKLCPDLDDTDGIGSSHDQCLPLSSSTSVPKLSLSASEKAARKKQFRETVCRTFVAQLKPHYQAKKFKTPNDYTHLLRTLSRNFFKDFKSFNCTIRSSTSADTWELKDIVRNEIASIVSRVMSQCTVYSTDLDTQLDL